MYCQVISLVGWPKLQVLESYQIEASNRSSKQIATMPLIPAAFPLAIVVSSKSEGDFDIPWKTYIQFTATLDCVHCSRLGETGRASLILCKDTMLLEHVA